MLRRRRWEEAPFAAALLGIVAVQTVVMLQVWDGFQILLGKVGIESYIGAELTGRQMLRWTVQLEGESQPSDSVGSDGNAEIAIDALTGEVTSIITWS
ncbi:MAG: hypothetical protein M1358_21305 [Chloroflexi bacterium]|nr:hypothetical protein [Chloroflexota bacterium]